MKTSFPIDRVLLYDGTCSRCQSLAFVLQKTLRLPSVHFFSFRELSEEDLPYLSTQLSWEHCEREVQWIENGKRYPGFFGLRRLVWLSPWARFLAPLLYLPLVPFLGMGLLYWLGRTRKSL